MTHAPTTRYQGETPRTLDFFFLLDTSGSMRVNGRIESLNQVIREAIPLMQQVASQHREGRLQIRAIRFDNTASWHVATPTPIDQFTWNDLKAGGETAMGAAFDLLATVMEQGVLPT